MKFKKICATAILSSAILLAGSQSAISHPSHRAAPEFDNSGRGAVLCAAMINIEVKAYADICKPKGGEQVSAALGDALDDIAAFSAANSERSKADYASWMDRRYQASVAREKDNESFCSSKNATEFYEPLPLS